MKNTRTVNKSERNKKTTSQEQTVEVLYQKLGDRWYAFSLINDEVFVGSISQSEVAGNSEKQSKAKSKKMAGHS
jgi:hypothetical protein